MIGSWNRRTLLKTAAGTSAGALLGAHRFGRARAQDPTPAPTPTPILLGEGDISITIWVEDFGPSVDYYRRAASSYVAREPNVKVTVQSIPYQDLLAKMLPSVAAGTEGDIMLGYSDWFVATDITKLFLPLDEYMGGKAELERSLFPSTLTALDLPEGKVYYVPDSGGIRAAATTVNVAQFQEAGIDYLSFATWEDLVAAGQALTVKEGDKIVRAGLSPVTAQLSLLKSWIWQMGGEFYDGASGTWSLATPEGEAAAQILYDLFWGASPTSSYDLVSFDNEYTGFEQGIVSADLNGAWTVGIHEQVVPELDVDGIPTPALAGAVADVFYPDPLAVVTLSRRLADDEEKRNHCVGIIKELWTPDSLIELTDIYSGILCSKDIYADPRIMETTYGPFSKRIAEATWPRARFTRDHVANQQPAQIELDRALRKEISISEALGNMDDYLNDQEKQARERIGI